MMNCLNELGKAVLKALKNNYCKIHYLITIKKTKKQKLLTEDVERCKQ